jgi:uncharacterized iron-regulated membrane protein
MKLSRHAFVRFWDVHAWLGVTGGIVLHVMFFAGGFALFFDELGAWQEPELAPAPGAAVAPLVERALSSRGVRPASVDVTLPGPRRRALDLRWTDARTGAGGEARIAAATGAEISETSHAVRILFWLHFLYHPRLPWGIYAAGVFGAALLLAIVTGVLIQLKDLIRQLDQFRPAKSIRVLWSDLHKVLGVLGLPFQTMYALTGALIGLAPLLISVVGGPAAGARLEESQRAWWGETAPGTSTGKPAQALSVDELVARARRAVPGFEPEFARLEAMNDTSMRASFWGAGRGRLFSHGDVVLDARDGALVADSVSAPPTPAAAVSRWTTGMHYAWFEGLAMRAIFAILAAATCLTILSGNWIWLARRARGASWGDRLLARLTIGVGGGIALATAALFWANRLAPPPVRVLVETWAFFGTWALATVLFAVRVEARGGWVGLLGASGVGFALVPALTLARFGTRAGLSAVDGGLWLVGMLLLLTAVVVERYQRRAPTRDARGPYVPGPRERISSP